MLLGRGGNDKDGQHTVHYLSFDYCWRNYLTRLHTIPLVPPRLYIYIHTVYVDRCKHRLQNKYCDRQGRIQAHPIPKSNVVICIPQMM